MFTFSSPTEHTNIFLDQSAISNVLQGGTDLIPCSGLEIIIRTAVTQNTIASVGLENPRFHETSDSTDWFTTSPEYRSFLTSESATLLWYPGPPQSGKSTLVGRICQETLNQKSNNNVYCAYYSEITADRTSNKLDNFFARFPHRIFQRLLAQILIQTVKRDGSLGKAPQGQELPPTVKENIRLFPHYWSDVFTNVDYILPDTHNKIMKDLLLVTLVAIKPISVLLAIDDLDHMSVRNRETFLALLLNLWKELQRENVAVHILVISRPYSDIGALLEDVPTILQHRDYKGKVATITKIILYATNNYDRVLSHFVFRRDAHSSRPSSHCISKYISVDMETPQIRRMVFCRWVRQVKYSLDSREAWKRQVDTCQDDQGIPGSSF